jgi:hypothetical protein
MYGAYLEMAGALFFLESTVQSRKVHDKPHAEKQKQKKEKKLKI